MGKYLMRRHRAYMTIEASFIVPMMVFILIIIIYWSFYTYNNCVVYQDCYIASLRGSQLVDSDQEEIERLVIKYADELLDNQIFQFQNKPKVKVGLFNISVSAESAIDNLMYNYFNQDKKLNINREANSKRINPITIVRSIY